MSTANTIAAETKFAEARGARYAYRRFGEGPGLPLLCLQHFTGTLDFWDPAVTDALAAGREVILFDNAGVGRSSGKVPETMAGMAAHVLAFADAIGLKICDVLGFSLGGCIAQVVAQERPSLLRRMVLVGTAPRGGEDVMHLEKPSLAKPLSDPTLQGYAVLQKIFFAPSETSQAAGAAYVERTGRTHDAIERAASLGQRARTAHFRCFDRRPNCFDFAAARGCWIGHGRIREAAPYAPGL